ncbi:MAG: hypothetical protein ABW171_13685 [Steroidobacter sp.]
MWFAKWFGDRSASADEPARFAPAAARPAAPVKQVRSKVGGAKALTAQQVKSGFDPYNSGSFDRNEAWQRIIRR